jgi:hypothetical protein
MRVILQSGCRIQRTTTSLHYVYCGPGHIRSIYSSAYSGHNIQLNLSALLLEIRRQFNACCSTNFAQMQRTSPSLRYVNCGPGNIQFIYNSSYSGDNIQVKVSALLLDIFQHFDARYTINLVSNTGHTV